MNKPPIKKPRQITYDVNDTGCWICTSHKVNKNDGYFSYHINNKPIKMHRYMYIQKYGPFPEHLIIRHKCDNPQCINPDHLETGTRADNAMDCIMRGRKPRGVDTHTAKLNDDLVREILTIGISNYNDIAKRYNVARATIRDILLRKTWKHVEI